MSKKPLIFESADAIDVGGSYVVDTDGRPVRDDANSGGQEAAQVADGAPGPAAELNAAAVGVAPAQPEASAKGKAKA